MLVLFNGDGYVESYALIGGLESGIEIADPEDEEWFAEHFEACHYDGDKLVYDAEKYDKIVAERNKPVETVADTITDLQLALAEVYEMLEGGRS